MPRIKILILALTVLFGLGLFRPDLGVKSLLATGNFSFITVAKVSVGGDGNFSYTAFGGNGLPSAFFVPTSGGTGFRSFSVSPGNYSILENVPSGWKFTSLTVSSFTGGSVISKKDSSALILLALGDSVTAIYTNTRQAGAIIIRKLTLGANGNFSYTTSGGNGLPASFAISTSGDSGSHAFYDLPSGNYTVTENVPAGWSFISLQCSTSSGSSKISLNDSSSLISLIVPDTVVCTYTNATCQITCGTRDTTVMNDPGKCGAVVNFSPPSTTGNCGTVTCTPPSGSLFLIGKTTVTCSSSDGHQCSFTVTVRVGNNCPLSPGFWKTHPSAWPVSSITLGDQTYTKSEALAILRSSTTGDASIILARALIAAILNTANGSDPTPICSALGQANALLSGFGKKLPYAVKPSSPTGQAMTNAAGILDSYNNGLLTRRCRPSLNAPVIPGEGSGEFRLEQSYPNPFNPQTEIAYTISEPSHVDLRVYDLLGHEVRVLVSGDAGAGSYSIPWDGKDEGGKLLPSGVYLYRLTSGELTQVKRMLLIR